MYPPTRRRWAVKRAARDDERTARSWTVGASSRKQDGGRISTIRRPVLDVARESDIDAARAELAARGVDISEVFHARTPGAQFQSQGTRGRVSGPAPNHASYGSFATFSDPDGNSWVLQEVTTRLPGRIDTAQTSYASEHDLANALRRAASAHGEHEKRIGNVDGNWSDWYAAYMVAERTGPPRVNLEAEAEPLTALRRP